MNGIFYTGYERFFKTNFTQFKLKITQTINQVELLKSSAYKTKCSKAKLRLTLLIIIVILN